MTTLYDLAAEWLDASEDIDDETGEVSSGMEARLDAITGDLLAKVDAVAKVRSNALADAAALKAEAARLTDRRRTAERKAERLKDYLGTCLRLMGERKIVTSTHTVSLRKTPPSVVLDVPVSELPPSMLKPPPPPSADLREIKRALETEGVADHLAHLETRDTVQVK